jgi:hypothetical protein
MRVTKNPLSDEKNEKNLKKLKKFLKKGVKTLYNFSVIKYNSTIITSPQ